MFRASLEELECQPALPLTEISRACARQILAVARRAEAASFVVQLVTSAFRQRVVRHGAGPERTIQTGVGPIPVWRQKVRDRATGVPSENRGS